MGIHHIFTLVWLWLPVLLGFSFFLKVVEWEEIKGRPIEVVKGGMAFLQRLTKSSFFGFQASSALKGGGIWLNIYKIVNAVEEFE